MEQYKSTISVILPVYNTGSILQETIDSVLKQTFQDFELIIINDGSSDAVTLDILNKQQDKRIRVINQHNQGVAAARNRGLQEAVGKYIAFLDHDDIFMPNKLEVLSNVLDNSPETAIVYTAIEPFGENSAKALRLPKFSEISYQMLLGRNYIYSMSCVMLNAAIVKENKIIFDHDCVPCDDWDFYLQCALYGKIKHYPKTLVKYRLYTNNQSNDQKKMYLAGIRVARKHRKNICQTSKLLKKSVFCLKMSSAKALSEHYYGLAFQLYCQHKYFQAVKNICKAFCAHPFYPKLPLYIWKKLRSRS